MTTRAPSDSSFHEIAEALPSSFGRLAQAEQLLASRHVPEALAALSDSELNALHPDACAGNRWQCYMLLGDLENAWKESDTLRRRGSPDPHRFWDGSPLTGKRVILRCLHGLGDAIQFLRFLPRLARITAYLILEVPPPLIDLAPFFCGADEVITWGEEAPLAPPDWDVQIEIMEVPFILRAHLSDLPSPSAALRLPRPTSHLTTISAAAPRVGMIWTSGSWNPSRSLPLALLGPLLSLSPQVSFFSLQPSSANADWDAHTHRYRLPSSGISLDSVLALTEFIAGLDLVITVDTLAAHLGGALDVPTWILLQYEADWRWMLNRDDTPWYPSARLFRQPVPGDWQTPIAAMRDELETRFDSRRHPEVSHAPLG